MVMLDSARRGIPTPGLARMMLAAGIAVTLVANVLAGVAFGVLGAVVAAWPALALVGSYELSPGVLSLSHDVASERSAESFCNTSCGCGARCCRCSEAWLSRTRHMCNTSRGGGE
jgi:hypothetical protein